MSEQEQQQLKIMPVETTWRAGKCQSHPGGYESAIKTYSYSTISKKRVADYALQQLEAARVADVATHEANLPALENNKLIADQVNAFMASIGMPTSYSERDPKSRSMYPKSIKRDAGWIADLRRWVPTVDGFAGAEQTYKSLKQRYDEYAAAAAREEEQAARETEQARLREVEKRKADMELATILLRYSLPIESSWSEVLEALRTKHQRLNLAIAMEQTRGDWSEGPYRVRNALDRFTIESNEDKEIAAAVAECLYDFDDGRVFRDIGWNYSALYASIEDQQLVADACIAVQRCER